MWRHGVEGCGYRRSHVADSERYHVQRPAGVRARSRAVRYGSVFRGIGAVSKTALSKEEIERIALKHEAFGCGQVDAHGLTTRLRRRRFDGFCRGAF